MAIGTTTLAIIAAVGTLASAAGRVIGSQQQAANLKFNAAAQRQAAEYRMNVARARAEDRRKESRRVQAAARARLASSGVIPDAGTGLDIQGQIARQGEVNALREIVAGMTDADYLNTNAALSQSQVGPTRLLGFVNAGATALTGARRIGSFGTGGSPGPASASEIAAVAPFGGTGNYI